MYQASGPEPKEDANKAPLTTIPEHWESLVQDRKTQESSSGSDTASESDSESGTNEATSSSSTLSTVMTSKITLSIDEYHLEIDMN